ncbi:MAG TPA: LysM domain-containing protein [Acidimicrobiales bacterium]|nr:LysM domain-containing protein [Acidimicrobiales bacterium]
MVAVAVARRPAGTFSARTVRAPRPRTGRAPSAEVVYRRRRLVAAVLTLSVLLGGRAVADLAGSGPLVAAEPTPPVLIGERVHIVQPGDTLWTIARSLQPSGDVRRLVDALAARRQGAALHVGERIALP